MRKLLVYIALSSSLMFGHDQHHVTTQTPKSANKQQDSTHNKQDTTNDQPNPTTAQPETTSEQQTYTPKRFNPDQIKPIDLFDLRKLSKRLAQNNPATPTEVLTWHELPNSYQELEKAIGKQLTQTAHDTQRRDQVSGRLVEPSAIVASYSGKLTLELTVKSLKNAGLAPHFIVDTDGTIYQSRLSNETLEQAVQHRAYFVGESGFNYNSHETIRDLNSASISIVVIGQTNSAIPSEQEKSFVNLTQYLSEKYTINPNHVLDYGTVAYTYGRRDTQNALMALLATYKLATYPQEKEINSTILPETDERGRIIWASLALSKIGFINCPATTDPKEPAFLAALIAFQRYAHEQQNGIVTDVTMRKLNSMIIQHERNNPRIKTILPPPLALHKTAPAACAQQNDTADNAPTLKPEPMVTQPKQNNPEGKDIVPPSLQTTNQAK